MANDSVEAILKLVVLVTDLDDLVIATITGLLARMKAAE
jgi:hypothetical protein